MSSSSMPKSRPQSSSRPLGSASDGDANPESVIRSSYGTGSTDEDVAMMLEDFAMGHRVNRSRAAQELDPGPSDLYTHRQMTAYGSQSAPPRRESHENATRSLPLTPVSATDVFVPQLGLPDHHPLALLIDINTNVVGRLVSVLPAKSHCMTLVTFYFERLEWYSKVLHSPSFLSDAHQLLGQVFSTSSNGPLCDYSVLVHVSVPFLSVYFMVLCLSLHLIEPDTCRILNIGFDEATELSKKMYNAAQACLYQNLDEADSHWALLGSAIKMAQNLGISRLGSESDNKTYTGIWTSVIKREVARRIWWSLIFNDWSHAAAHNGAYSIHPSQNHTGFPANINDVDLVDGFPLKVRPIMEYTEMTLSLTRFRFVGIYREIVDNMQSPTGYDFVTEIDAKIRKLQAEVPRYFEEYNLNTPDNSASPPPYNPAQNVKQLELTLCLLMGETRQLRLHRPYLFKGYKDRKYAKSREQCINSARAILNLLKSNDEQSAILLKWWMVLFYGFAASVVLFIDLCHHKADNGLELEMRRVELREALDLFKTVEHISTVSRNAIALLEGLMTTVGVEPDIPSKPSRKRGAYTQESEEPFGQVVKRMIIDAHQTACSPISQSNGSLVSSPTKPLSPASTPHATLHHRSRSESYTTSSLNVTPEVGIDEYPPRISIPVNRAMPSSSSRWSSTLSLPHTLSNGLSMAPSGHSSTNQRGKDVLTCVNPIGGELDNSSTPPFGLGWGLPARDALAPNILFRESEMFEASIRQLDEATMNELGQLLWSDESFVHGIRNAGTPGNLESARDEISLAGFESFHGMAFTGT
ncbi:hypothetical protein EV368DRAFT_61903 [Lentinula lateritia]|nr:hypothetical protein EV368DRAFT_61903 [Lentinula lateritia]